MNTHITTISATATTHKLSTVLGIGPIPSAGMPRMPVHRTLNTAAWDDVLVACLMRERGGGEEGVWTLDVVQQPIAHPALLPLNEIYE